MNVFALDTNVVSYYLRKNNSIRDKISNVVEEGNTIDIPPIVYFEIRRGLLSIFAPVKTKAFHELCTAYPVRILTQDVLKQAAIIYTDLKKKGQLIEDADLLIAADCICNKLTLVTNNVEHFKNIDGLQVLNWMDT